MKHTLLTTEDTTVGPMTTEVLCLMIPVFSNVMRSNPTNMFWAFGKQWTEWQRERVCVCVCVKRYQVYFQVASYGPSQSTWTLISKDWSHWWSPIGHCNIRIKQMISNVIELNWSTDHHPSSIIELNQSHHTHQNTNPSPTSTTAMSTFISVKYRNANNVVMSKNVAGMLCSFTAWRMGGSSEHTYSMSQI